MAFWKKITELFVETEETVIEETPVPVKEEIIVEEKIPSEKKIDVIETETVTEEKSKENKKSIFIHDVVPTKKVTEESNEMPVYEMKTIISPIFGIDEKSQITKPKPVVTRSVIHNSSALGTILSPIYGLDIGNQTPIVHANYVDEDEITNIPLDDMIQKNESGIEETLFQKDKEEFKLEIPFRNHQEETVSFSEKKTEEIIEKNNEEIRETAEEFSQIEDAIIEKNDEISRIMQQMSEEYLFEKDGQLTLFDLVEKDD